MPKDGSERAGTSSSGVLDSPPASDLNAANPQTAAAYGFAPGSSTGVGGSHRSLLALLLLLSFLAAILSRGITQGELYYFNDETRHAMNGVFIRDLLADAPFSNPIEYAFLYYAKYPATALPHWPPLFAFLEGILFLIFGVHVWVARLLVLGFALMGAYYWYRIAEGFGPSYRAWVSTLVFALLPLIQTYSSVLMLEIPLLALSLGTLYYWLRFCQSGRALPLWLMAGFLAASFLTSQKAIFLPLLLVLLFVVRGPYRLLLRWQVWAAAVVALGLVVPWYLFSFRYLSVGLDRAVGLGVASFAQHWIWQASFYLKAVPEQLGWPLAILAAAGIGWALLRAPRRYGVLLLWVASCYVCFTLIWEKDVRHTMIWIPPLVYFALLAIEVLLGGRRWAVVAGGALAVVAVVQAFGFQRPQMEGVGKAAEFMLSLPESDVTYYQGSLNGSFIFEVRRRDPEKRRVVARSKLVLATRVQYAKEAILTTPDDVIKLFRRWHIRYLALENHNELSELALVNRTLQAGPFEVVRDFPIESPDPEFIGRRIVVYRYTGEFEPHSEPVVIPMMTLRNRNIAVHLRDLYGAPWPR